MTSRLNRPVTMRELLERDGGAMLGNAQPCPKCGKEPKPFEVITPRKGYVLMFLIPLCGPCPHEDRR